MVARTGGPVAYSPYGGSTPTVIHRPEPTPASGPSKVVQQARPEIVTASHQQRPAGLTPLSQFAPPSTPAVVPGLVRPAEVREAPRKVEPIPILAVHTPKPTPANPPISEPAGPIKVAPPANRGPIQVASVPQAAARPSHGGSAQPSASAIRLQGFLKQRIETACGGAARNVAVTVVSAGELQVSARVRTEADGQQVGRKILQLPELAPYRVALDVEVGQ